MQNIKPLFFRLGVERKKIVQLVASLAILLFMSTAAKAQCSLAVNHYELICNDNGTAANPADDYVTIVINADGTNVSANFRVLVQTLGGGTTLFTSSITAYGTEITLVGDGLAGNPLLPADGTSTWQLTVWHLLSNFRYITS